MSNTPFGRCLFVRTWDMDIQGAPAAVRLVVVNRSVSSGGSGLGECVTAVPAVFAPCAIGVSICSSSTYHHMHPFSLHAPTHCYFWRLVVSTDANIPAEYWPSCLS